jgi:hypothetical protein
MPPRRGTPPSCHPPLPTLARGGPPPHAAITEHQRSGAKVNKMLRLAADRAACRGAGGLHARLTPPLASLTGDHQLYRAGRASSTRLCHHVHLEECGHDVPKVRGPLCHTCAQCAQGADEVQIEPSERHARARHDLGGWQARQARCAHQPCTARFFADMAQHSAPPCRTLGLLLRIVPQAACAACPSRKGSCSCSRSRHSVDVGPARCA